MVAARGILYLLYLTPHDPHHNTNTKGHAVEVDAVMLSAKCYLSAVPAVIGMHAFVSRHLRCSSQGNPRPSLLPWRPGTRCIPPLVAVSHPCSGHQGICLLLQGISTAAIRGQRNVACPPPNTLVVLPSRHQRCFVFSCRPIPTAAGRGQGHAVCPPLVLAGRAGSSWLHPLPQCQLPFRLHHGLR